MKILISSGEFNNTRNADNYIAISLAREFQKQGHECEIIGSTFDYHYDDSEFPVKIHRVPFAWLSFLRACDQIKQTFHGDGTVRLSGRQKLMFTAAHPISSLLLQLNNNPDFHDRMQNDYARQVRGFLKHHDYDVLICIVFPFEKAECLLRDPGISIKKVYYQLDPYGTSRLLPEEQASIRAEQEAEAMAHADLVLTTPELLKEYQNDRRYGDIICKAAAVEFPTMLPLSDHSAVCPISYHPQDINILFCGTMSEKARNPEFILKLFSMLFDEDQSIRLHFLGDIQSDTVRTYSRRYPARILLHPSVSQDQAISAMLSCDLLLNIGNSITNMVPSKIFTYFATGKPIISALKSKDSPESRYFALYPLQFTVLESEPISVKTVLNFIYANRGKSLDQKVPMSLFHANTPAEVAAEMLHMIQ